MLKKLLDKIDFKVYFREITTKVSGVMKLHEFLRFQNAITLARNKSFPFRKKILVAAILLYQKQQNSENRPL